MAQHFFQKYVQKVQYLQTFVWLHFPTRFAWQLLPASHTLYKRHTVYVTFLKRKCIIQSKLNIPLIFATDTILINVIMLQRQSVYHNCSIVCTRARLSLIFDKLMLMRRTKLRTMIQTRIFPCPSMIF